MSESGMEWMSGGAKRQCDRALPRPARQAAGGWSAPWTRPFSAGSGPGSNGDGTLARAELTAGLRPGGSLITTRVVFSRLYGDLMVVLKIPPCCKNPPWGG